MNLDNIKDLWNKDTDAELPEISLEKQKEIATPLEKIRKNMKTEFWLSVASLPIIIIAFYPMINSVQKGVLFALFYIMMMLIIVYYFSRFYKLYKKINTQSFSTYHNLLQLRYELILNTELYKSYYVASFPIIFSLFLIIYGDSLITYSGLFFISISCLMVFLIFYFMGKVFLKEMYGKHIVEISDLVDQFTEEKSDFQFNRNSLQSKKNYKLIETTKLFFLKKFGKNGGIINTIVWSFILISLLIIISYVAGYAIGYFGMKFNVIDIETLE